MKTDATGIRPYLLKDVLADDADRRVLHNAIQKAAGSLNKFVESYENVLTSRFVFPLIDAEENRDSWLFIQRAEDSMDDVTQQEMRKTFSAREDEPVYLNTADGHQRSVEYRAKCFLHTLRLPDELCHDVMVAALHHDDGKKDPRFQRLLHFRMPKPEKYDEMSYLAKSRYHSPVYEAGIRRELNLRGWRHEQRSAAECWAKHDSIGANDIELVTRLAGTSHGHGRSCFLDDATTLIPQYVLDHCDSDPTLDIDEIRSAAEELFDEGMWERIISHTNMRYGYWGIAYLEAVLRSADITISAEGR